MSQCKSTYEMVVGLEIHSELRTHSKIFCGCSTVFGGAPNSHCCPVCLGLPGALPVLNERAVELGIKAGLALGCSIPNECKFDRKNYFYPDLPKAYQVSQFDQPLCVSGLVTYVYGEQKLDVRITRVHLEEEAGKSVHSGDNILGSEFSSLDYNRSGIPLIEIVTEPDLRSAAQAKAFLEQLRLILQYADVSDCKMEEGSLRCDANISLRPWNTSELGTKVEIKNLNSFRAVERALLYEYERQSQALTTGQTIIQETRAWDEAAGVTRSMRSKEDSHDYRYFPEPDLPPLAISELWVEELRKDLPELPQGLRNRLETAYGLSPYESQFLVQNLGWAPFFEQVIKQKGDAKTVMNWLMGDVSRILNAEQAVLMSCGLEPEALAELLTMIAEGRISATQGKTVLEKLIIEGGSPDNVASSLGLKQVSGTEALEPMIRQVLSEQSDAVARYKDGEEKLFGFLVGQVMKVSQGSANPKMVNQLLQDILRET